MQDLTPYATAFDSVYPKYATDEYQKIAELTSRLSSPDALETIESAEFKRFAELARPIIAIKNYKSQVPFPSDLVKVVSHAVQLKQYKISDPALSGEVKRHLLAIIELEGFQLPTASAIFHFCHPDHFPIVDRNVEAACALLKAFYPTNFDGYEAPRLPVVTTSAGNKVTKYRSFITFIDRIRHLHDEQYGGTASYRFVDKALMVFGVEKLRRLV